jgi:hypothetical protein
VRLGAPPRAATTTIWLAAKTPPAKSSLKIHVVRKRQKRGMNSEDDINLLSKIYIVVTDISGVRSSQLNWRAAINNDLHIYGDDVDEIFMEIEKSYPFAWQTVPFSQYFAEEGANINYFTGLALRLITIPIRVILWLLSKKYGPKYYNAINSWLDRFDSPRPRTPFTIGHLFAFVRHQTWSDELQIPHNLPEIDNMALKRILKR